MNTQELIRKILIRIFKFRIPILAAGALLAAAMFFYARSKPTIYTSRTSVFPLNASSDNSMASSALSQLFGGAESSKSFSQDASINIVELATSRNTRESVVMERLPEKGNKRIVDLLIENYNKYRNPWSAAMVPPKDEASLAAYGGMMLKGGIDAKINKNGILEVNYSNTDETLVSPISYVLIDKISQFYKDLKVKKAQFDYSFTVRKLDSLKTVLNVYDRRAVTMSNTSMFVPEERIQYTIPKENLINEKSRVLRQSDAAANNREEALWRLQKVTPIIEILDKPDPPFDVTKPSSMIYTIIGFMLGAFLFTFLLVLPLLYRFIKLEVRKMIVQNSETTEAKFNTTVSSSSSTIV